MPAIRRLLLGLACSLAIVLGPASAQAQAPRTIRISAFTQDAPTAIARSTGALAQVGLDADLSITRSSTEQMRGLIDGSYDMVYTAFDNVLAWSGRDGGPELVVVAQVSDAVVLPIFVRPEITDWEGLRGKPLAVDAVDTAFALVLRRVLLEHGLDLEQGDYSLLPLGAPAARLDSMVKGQTFAGILNPPNDALAAAAGLVYFGDHSEVLPSYPGTVIVVRRDWAAEHRTELEAFLRAWIQAGRFTAANPEQASQLFSRAANVPLEATPSLLPLGFNHGTLNLPGLQSVIDLRTQFGFGLPLGDRLSRFIDPSFQIRAAAQPSK